MEYYKLSTQEKSNDVRDRGEIPAGRWLTFKSSVGQSPSVYALQLHQKSEYKSFG